MLSPVQIDYNPSNGSWNVFCIEVLKKYHNPISMDCEVWEVQPWGFQSLSHAMVFLQQQIASPLAQEKPGDVWSADLKRNSDLKGLRVRIQQLVMVFK